MMRLLIKLGARLNGTDSLGRTPLHWATYREDHKAVGILLAEEADWQYRDGQGRTCMHLSMGNKRVKCLALLLKKAKGHEINEGDNQM